MYIPVTIVLRVPTVPEEAVYCQAKTVVIELAYKVLPSALKVIPWFKALSEISSLVDAIQPSALMV